MVHPPPSGCSNLANKKVLLIDPNQPTRDVRAAIFRSHGVKAHTAEDLRTARLPWHPNLYDLIVLDMRKHLPGEAREFCELVRRASPEQRIAFLVGPPVYLSLTWPDEVIARTAEPQPREQAVRFVAAA